MCARRLVFALTYMVSVFLISRIVDVAIISYKLTSISLLPVRVVLDPAILSVKNLKTILENRGISYGGVVEKKELHDLIHASGDLSDEELRSSSLKHDVEPAITELASGSHFFEVVEDTKDSAWIVIVVPLISGIMALDRVTEEWKEVVRQTSKFGLRAARFDCSLDPGFCESRNWTSARLLLAVPKHDTSKGDVVLKQYMIRSSFSSSSIFRWIRDELASRVKVIDSVSGLTRNWLQIRHSDDHIMRTSVVLISRLETPPLLLSALAIKFNGRAVFGMYRVNGKHDRIQIRGINFDFPVCAISLSNDSVYLFGKQAGETFNFRSMELLMKSFNPEMNDLFVLSLILVNVVVSMDLFWIRCSKAWKYVVYWLIQAVKTNCFLFFVWLSILTICGLPSVRPVLNACLCWMQSIACTHFAAIVRHDAAIYYHRLPVIFAAYVVSCIAVVAVRQKFFSRPGVFDDDHLFREWSPLESTILSYILFRPIGMSMPPTATLIQSNLEDGMEQLIERLAFPNLWLQDDLISNEYINSLPVWLHTEAIHPESGSNNEESADHRSSSVSESELGASSPTSKSSQPRGSCQSFQSSIPVKYSPTKSLRKRNVSAGSRSKAAAPAQVHESSQRDVGPESAAPVGSISSSECAICLETYRQNQILCGLPCGHSYHESCILSWLLRDNHICPTCRWPSNRAKIR